MKICKNFVHFLFFFAKIDLFFIVDCGDPVVPMNGTLRQYSHTILGTIIQFWCNKGFYPEDLVTSVCSENGEWRPPLHTCRGIEIK